MFEPAQASARPWPRGWAWLLPALLVAGLWAGLPVASDEAYFVSWGRVWRWGFYDHPPLPGWISWLLWRLSEAFGLVPGVLHRGFAALMGVAGLWLLARAWRGFRGSGAGGAVLALALVPGWVVLFALFLNDTILTFATLLFLLALGRCWRGGGWGWHLAAGLALAAMALTKYNGALVWLGAVAGLAGWPAGRRFLWRSLLPVSLIALVPFLGHLWWNLNNCSATLGFNFVFRTARATGWGVPWLALTLLLATGPVGVAALLGALGRGGGGGGGAPAFFRRLFLGTLAVALAVALWRGEFGVNWAAPMIPLAFLALAEGGAGVNAARLARWGGAMSLLLLGPVILLLLALRFELASPAGLLPPARAAAAGLILDLRDGALAARLAGAARGRVIAVPEYGLAAMLENRGLGPVVVLSRSVFGRNQDLFTDFAALDGRDMLILPAGVPPGRFASLFESLDVESLPAPRGAVTVLFGRGFRFEAFRRDWILPVWERFYARSPFPWRACPLREQAGRPPRPREG